MFNKKEWSKKYYLKNKKEHNKIMQIYYQNHKEEQNKRTQKYYQLHKEEINKKAKIYRKEHKEEIQIRMKKYSKLNRGNRRKYMQNYLKNINNKLKNYLRSRIYHVLKGIDKSKHTQELIGCSIEFLKFYLEKQFTKGMTWKNYGKWHVDHIRPCASFDLSKANEQKKCFHYSNLQPLWAEDNLRKGAN